MTNDDLKNLFVTYLKQLSQNKTNLIPALQHCQKLFKYIPSFAIEQISQHLKLSIADIYGVITFYEQFKLTPLGKYVIRVCTGTACHVNGANMLIETLQQELQIKTGETTKDGIFSLFTVACLGCCSLAPAMIINDKTYGQLTPTKIKKILKEYKIKEQQTQRLKPTVDENYENINANVANLEIFVGMGTCGLSSGAQDIFDTLQKTVHKYSLPINVQKTGCLGMCYKEPIVEIRTKENRFIYGQVKKQDVIKIVKNHIIQNKICKDLLILNITKSHQILGIESDYELIQKRIVLRNCGYINPEKIEDYEKQNGYKALKLVLSQKTPKQVIEEIKASGLRGRGGAGFPTGVKWEFCSKMPSSTKYVICNADEGDPGAFMDRSILEGDPHSVIEGMIICAYAIGATKGYIYCRAEYPLALNRLKIAISQAQRKQYLGNNILGTDFCFDIQIKEGAGAFVCGEETALIHSIEGERGMPRLKPPFPAQSGLWGNPTNINNVETLANIAWIMLNGSNEYNKIGTQNSKGTKVFALAGKVKRVGLVEVPMGISINDIVFKLGGGIQNNKTFKAIQIGGPSGGCIPAQMCDIPIDYESLTQTGAIMGSGGLIVMDDTTCMVDIARFFLEFTQKESCGKCTFCRLGTLRMLEILQRITNGKGTPQDIPKLLELSKQIKEASLCGLGQTAPNPVLTTLKYFENEYIEHIYNKKCPAKQCLALVNFVINPELCTGCGICAKNCPVNAIQGKHKEPYIIEQDKCIKCGKCIISCNFNAIYKE